MASFGVSLRSTSSSLLGAATATPAAVAAAAAPAPPLLLHLSSGGGVAGESVALLCAMHGIALQRREHNMMLGAPLSQASALPGAMAAAAAAAASPSASAAPVPSPSSLPMLVDGATVVSGWISCLKYVAWKAMANASSAACTPPSAALAQFYPLPFPPPGAAMPAVSSFTIDSAIESLMRYNPTLEALSHVFLTEALRAGHGGQISFLAHRFDKDGQRLVPRWGAARPVSAGPAGAGVPAPAHALEDPQAEAHALERQVRSLNLFVAELQEKLARANPALTAERAMQILRDTDPLRQPSDATVAATAAASAVPATGAAAAAPQDDVGAGFLYLLGTAHPTLADFVAFALLSRLSLLHSFLTPLSPQAQPHLFAYGGILGRQYGLGPAGVRPFAGAGLDGVAGRHVLMCRHPVLAVHCAPTTAAPSPPAAVPASAAASVAAKDEPASAASAAAASTTASASPSSCDSTLPSAASAPPSRQVPRLTNVSAPDSQSTRPAASTLAVEEVPDLMDYVDKLSVRARAVTPAGGLAEMVPRGARVANGAAAAVAAAAGSPVTAAAAAAASPTPAPSSLSQSKLLSQRLFHAVDHAALGWRTVREAGGVRTAVPMEPSTPEEAGPNAQGGGSSYHHLATTVLPVPAAVLLAFLWSPDAHRVLDGPSCPEARELAPHALAPLRARYVYLQLELKATTTTASAPAAASAAGTATGTGRRDTDATAPALPPTPSPAASPTSSSSTAAAAAPSSSPTSSSTAATATATSTATKTSSARVEFVLLNTWTKRLDGGYSLVSQSVGEDSLAEINAPKKFGKGCIRGSMGGVCAASAAAMATTAGSGSAARSRWLAQVAGVSGWVLRPVYLSSSATPGTEVTYLSNLSFPARMGSWVGPEVEKRTTRCVAQLRAQLRAMMGAHPLVQLRLAGGVRADAEAHLAAQQAASSSASSSSAVSGHSHGHGHRAPSGTVHFRLSQPVSPSLVHAVSGHGVQSTPHPRARG